MTEPIGLSWVYALTAQVGGILVLVYVVALLGARSFSPNAAPPRHQPRSQTELTLSTNAKGRLKAGPLSLCGSRIPDPRSPSPIPDISAAADPASARS